MTRTRSALALLIPVNLLLVTSFAKTAAAQNVPDSPPVYEMVVHQAPVQFIYPATSGAWAADWTPPSPMTQTLVAQIIVAHPRQRPTVRTNFTPVEGTEFGGRIWQFGRSGRYTNQPDGRGWHTSGYRMDCFKRFPEPNGNDNPATVQESYEGAPLTYANKSRFPYAHSVFVAFANGQAVAVRHDVDYGTHCMGGSTGMMCENPACERYHRCETPWVFPNTPCTSCGVPGLDTTRPDLGLYQYTTLNTFLDYASWQNPPAIQVGDGFVGNPGTTAQTVTNAGTPYMYAELVQRVAESDDNYSTPDGPVRQYTGGLYFEVIDQLKLYKGTNYPDGNRKYLGTFRIRRYLLWEFSQTGLFDYLADWFRGDAHAGMCDGAECCEATDLFAFLTAWFEGQ